MVAYPPVKDWDLDKVLFRIPLTPYFVVKIDYSGNKLYALAVKRFWHYKGKYFYDVLG